MPAALGTDVLTRDIRGEPAGGQPRILVHREFHPVLGICRIGSGERHVGAGSREFIESVTGQFAQPFLRRRENALGLNQRRRCGIKRCLGFLHVGHGDQADFEAFFRLLELARDGIICGLSRLERVLRSQHNEVGFRCPQDQVLLRCVIVRLGLRALGVRAPQGGPVLPAEYALAQCQVPALARSFAAQLLRHGRQAGSDECARATCRIASS